MDDGTIPERVVERMLKVTASPFDIFQMSFDRVFPYSRGLVRSTWIFARGIGEWTDFFNGRFRKSIIVEVRVGIIF